MGARSSQSRGPGLNKTDGHLVEYFRQSFGAGGGGTNTTPAGGHTATGGFISDYTSGSNVYRAHIFTSSGTFDVTEVGGLEDTVQYLVVAGGGAGAITNGGYGAGGGGAGGLRTNVPGVEDAGANPLTAAAFPITASPYPVVIGAGGAGMHGGPDASGTKGGNSNFSTIIATGGGGGVRNNPAPANCSGGSGGGGYNNNPGQPGNNPPTSPPQGNNGGNSPNDDTGSGGGGAGAVGGAGSGPEGGAGGAGVVPRAARRLGYDPRAHLRHLQVVLLLLLVLRVRHRAADLDLAPAAPAAVHAEHLVRPSVGVRRRLRRALRHHLVRRARVQLAPAQQTA